MAQRNKKESENVTVRESIEAVIFTVRDQRVVLDSDLARLYGVETRRLNEQVRRNASRFPDDFVFQLSPQEVRDNWSQIATSSGKRRGKSYRPPRKQIGFHVRERRGRYSDKGKRKKDSTK